MYVGFLMAGGHCSQYGNLQVIAYGSRAALLHAEPIEPAFVSFARADRFVILAHSRSKQRFTA